MLQWNDQRCMADCLASQKHMATLYNTVAEHSDDHTFLRDLMELCRDEHEIRLQIYQHMHRRGWYQPKGVDQQQLQQARQQFQQTLQQLQGSNPSGWQAGLQQQQFPQTGVHQPVHS